MELEKMKNAWKKIETPSGKKILDQEIVHEMIEKTGKTALNRLLFFEILGIGVLILLLILLFTHLFPEMIYRVTPWLITTLSVLCIVGVFWQLYKVSFLRNINMAHDNITEVARKIYTYRKYIMYEAVIGVLFFIIIIPVYIVAIHRAAFGNEIIVPLLVFYITVFILGLVLMYYLYKSMYLNNIKKLRQMLKEIEEFEKE